MLDSFRKPAHLESIDSDALEGLSVGIGAWELSGTSQICVRFRDESPAPHHRSHPGRLATWSQGACVVETVSLFR